MLCGKIYALTQARCLAVLGAAFGMVVLVTAVPVRAASFDCAKATTTVEKLICSEPELSALDEQLSKAYAGAREAAGSSQALIAEQRSWLAERNRCADAACIKMAYTARLAQLQPMGGEAVAQEAATPSEHLEPWQAACPAPNIDWRNYEWTIIVGNGWTACEEMLGYLRSRPKDQPPAVCPDERLPPNGNWTRPDWKEPPEPLRSELLRDLAAHGQDLGPDGTVYIARTDITRDGIPETLLVRGYTTGIANERCKESTYCAIFNRDGKAAVRLQSGREGRVFAMNDEGTAIDWSRAGGAKNGLLSLGELVYYKGNPYWLSGVWWDQEVHDNFAKYRSGPNDPYAAIFRLAPLDFLTFGIGYKRGGAVDFRKISSVLPDENATCHFGYFHRDNLKQNPPKMR